MKSSDEGSHRLMLVGVRPLCFREAPSVRNGFLALAFSLLLFVFVFIPDVVQSSNSSGPPPTPVSSFGGLGWGELIAIGSFILGSILVLWLNRRRKVEKVIDKLHGAFEQVPEKEPEIVLTEKIKREFFLGHYRQSYWTYIGLGLVCTRDLKKKMEDRMNLIDEKHWPPKIEIVGERKQGKTMLLASLAFELQKSSSNVVLWSKGMESRKAADYQLLKDYQNLIVNPWWRRFRKRKLIVFIDDFWTWREDDLPDETRQQLLRFLEKIRPGDFLAIVSSSEELLPHPAGILPRLEMSSDEACAILAKIACEEPPLATQRLADQLMTKSGGERMYRGDLAAFMSLLTEEICSEQPDFSEDMVRAFTSLEPSWRKLLKWVAASQLLDCALPSVLVQRSFPGFQRREFETSLQGWVREEQLNGRRHGLSLGAPCLAVWILRMFYSVSTHSDLLGVYSELIEATDQCGLVTKEEAEFIRHLLYRLSRERHFHFLGVDKAVLARQLYSNHRSRIEGLAKSQTDMNSKCLWSATYARLNERAEATELCISALNEVEPRKMHLNAFVALATAVRMVDKPSLTFKAREQLAGQWTMVEKGDVQEPVNRLNQAVHAYLEILELLGENDTILEFLEDEDLPAHMAADPLTILKRAEAYEASGKLQKASEQYLTAVGLARELRTIRPDLLRHCLSRFGSFISANPGTEKWLQLQGADQYFDEAARLSQDLDYGYDDVLNYWAMYKESKEDIAKAQVLLKQAMEWAKERGNINPWVHIGMANSLARYGDRVGGRSRRECYALAEDLCWQIVNDQRIEWRPRLRAYRSLGRLVGGSVSYIASNRQPRPNTAEAETLLFQSFDSDEEARNDDSLKTGEDLRAHHALGHHYWARCRKEKNKDEERKLLAKVEFHLRKSFSGLPRQDLKGWRVDRIVSRNKRTYERFVHYTKSEGNSV